MEYAYNFELVVPLSILAGLGLVGSCLLAAGADDGIAAQDCYDDCDGKHGRLSPYGGQFGTTRVLYRVGFRPASGLISGTAMYQTGAVAPAITCSCVRAARRWQP